MVYIIKSHPTEYRGVQFRSRLEAKWACFFDLANWKWQYEPIDLEGWSPDFRVEFPCGHSNCGSWVDGEPMRDGSHVLLVEVKPFYDIKEFNGHPCMEYGYGGFPKEEGGPGLIPAHASAAFGADPSVTHWVMAHGAGGGSETIDNWVWGDIDAMWKQAGNIVQWKP